MGLQEERNSMAVENRSRSALERAKAVKELDSMDDERLIKYLKLIRMMEMGNEGDEKRAKSEDIDVAQISEQANLADVSTVLNDLNPPQVNPGQQVPQQQMGLPNG
jgi:hypothetical protein